MPALLGINCFSHDTAACILVDGELIALAEEERFNRDRHTKAFPDSAIAFCLRKAGLTIGEIDVVAVAQRPGRDLLLGAVDALRRGAPKRLAAQTYIDARLYAKEIAFRKRYGFRGHLVRVGHHEAHAANAFFSSPFDSAAVLTVDRGGDFLSTSMAVGEGSHIRFIDQVANPHSIGEVYSAITWYLGFLPNADEGKVMGLAPYGEDGLVNAISEMLYPTRAGRFKVNLSWFGYQREGSPVSVKFYNVYGPKRVPETGITSRDKDLAYAVQAVTENACIYIANSLRQLTGQANLCLSGGVALNSVMNAKLLEHCGFENIFIPPTASDAGNALGAALWAWHHLMGNDRGWEMRHAFYGEEYADEDIAVVLKRSGVPFREAVDPAAEAAELLTRGKVVGWFQGRAEVGPRALGARSILADPRRSEMRDIVNARVKRREWFRPFAPSILAEHGHEYFERYYPTPFMTMVLPIKSDKKEVIPAVCHVDGTGRLQTVTKDDNPLFHQLIREFAHKTGVPVVLNTSFNVRGEPIVHRPEEAIADFLNSDMDAVVLGRYIVEK